MFRVVRVIEGLAGLAIRVLRNRSRDPARTAAQHCAG